MPRTVDVHHHLLPAFYKDATREASGVTLPWSAEDTIAFLDDARIDVAVTSISYPGVHLGDDVAARNLARRCNEFAADLIRSYPGRFGAFAVLPLPDVDGALAELSYALDVLGLDGVVVHSNAGGIYLGDHRFDVVFEELQRRAAVVFVHPTACPDPSEHNLGLPVGLLGFVIDTSRAIAKLLYSNTFARTPDVKYIFAHAGGTIPYLAGRFAIFEETNRISEDSDRGSAADAFRRFYWDTALAWSDPVLGTLRSVVGIDRVLFGTDYPYLQGDLAVECRRRLEESQELNTSEVGAVLGATATNLFPRLATPNEP